ncbi:hypothetical protein QTO34_011629 [Cnephaeus nilssonii]|uniref:Uncharacterized protein n=1 Tax=Cnephaeus nilssonii TaxID=3371016 RepID=A0AA40LFA2_CNENI|nr:hypothetical protein QTO34_011629 [Eptesicus nilssonii]
MPHSRTAGNTDVGAKTLSQVNRCI